MRTKIMGALTSLICLLMVLSPASAGSASGNIQATSNINEVFDFSISNTALTYEFGESTGWLSPSEGPVTFSANGNFIGGVDVFAKLENPSGINFRHVYGEDSGLLTNVDKQIGIIGGEGLTSSYGFQAKVPVGGMDPGQYVDTIVITGVTNPMI